MRRPTQAAYRRAWAPRIDVYETEGDFVAVVELAGVDPSAVTIEMRNEGRRRGVLFFSRLSSVEVIERFSRGHGPW